MIRLLVYVCAIVVNVGNLDDGNLNVYKIIPVLIPLEKNFINTTTTGWLWTIVFSVVAIYYWSTNFDDMYLIATLLSVVASQPI